MAETRRERGERLFKEICGAPAAAMDGDFMDITIEHLFGDVWSRNDLASRDRRLLTIAVLAALGQTGPMEQHLGMALESGDLTRRELEGAVIHLTHYCGWPRGSALFAALAEVLQARESGEASP